MEDANVWTVQSYLEFLLHMFDVQQKRVHKNRYRPPSHPKILEFVLYTRHGIGLKKNRC